MPTPLRQLIDNGLEPIHRETDARYSGYRSPERKFGLTKKARENMMKFG